MAEQFARSVEYGLKLAKRIYYGKDARGAAPPKVPASMERSSSLGSTVERSLSVPEGAAAAYLPAAPMVYAAISEPSIVDNPEIASYQPYVHGRCDPPALIPLQMHGISMEIECYMDTAFVTVSGSWRVHCVLATKSCDCRVAIPMGEQGSLLGVEVDVSGKSYHTQLISIESTTDVDKITKAEDGGLLAPDIFTLKVPQVPGGSNLSLKFCWSQRLLYDSGEFCLRIPFNFPAYVLPATKKTLKREKIELNVNSGIDTEVLCKTASHPLKEIRRQVGKIGFLYEAEVHIWSAVDFNFSYAVYSRDICGGVLLQSPLLHDFDQREMFCLYLLPGVNPKVFRKEVIFVLDISGSMRGAPLEYAKNSLSAALSRLDTEDYFNIIAFNEDSRSFSSSLERATKEAVETATQWIGLNLVADGGTDVSLPLNQAIEMFSKASGSIPLMFLVTDGAVEDERHICNVIKSRLTVQGTICPRISTFGIGPYCNHYFLQMLAQIGRGYYSAACDIETVDVKLERLIAAASSVILANITIDSFDHIDAIELYPSQVPDLVSESPLVISGRYQGKFPDSLKVKGILADMCNFEMALKLQNVKDIPLDKLFARRQIDILTAQAWLLENKQIEEKVVRLSLVTGFPSEYTRMILLQTDTRKQAFDPLLIHQLPPCNDLKKMGDRNGQKIVFLQNLGVGFGNITATIKNSPPGLLANPQDRDGILLKAASNCCGRVADRCCCMCFIQACTYMNNQCSIAFTQICSALACFGCLSCCFDLCVSCD